MKPAVYLAVSGGKELAIASSFDYFSFTLIGARAGVEVSPLTWLRLFAQGTYRAFHCETAVPHRQSTC
jgi:hypothetical protein